MDCALPTHQGHRQETDQAWGRKIAQLVSICSAHFPWKHLSCLKGGRPASPLLATSWCISSLLKFHRTWACMADQGTNKAKTSQGILLDWYHWLVIFLANARLTNLLRHDQDQPNGFLVSIIKGAYLLIPYLVKERLNSDMISQSPVNDNRQLPERYWGLLVFFYHIDLLPHLTVLNQKMLGKKDMAQSLEFGCPAWYLAESKERPMSVRRKEQ